MEVYSRDIFRGDVLDILAVVLADDDVGDSGAFGCEYLLFDAAYRKNLAA